MIIAGQNFRRDRQVSSQPVIVYLSKNDITGPSIYNKSKLETINSSTTKVFDIGTFHELSLVVKNGTASFQFDTDTAVILNDGDNYKVDYPDLNTQKVTLITDSTAIITCSTKTT